MKILAIDLATKKYADFGWALLTHGSMQPRFLSADELGLQDPPRLEALVPALHQFCLGEDVRILLLDGPQAWRHPRSPIEHMRLCERVLNTPGKAGTPGVVKPKTYFNFVTFSIGLFSELSKLGWTLLHEVHLSNPPDHLIVEAFPSFNWRMLGLKKPPAKARTPAADLDTYRRSLANVTGYELPTGLTHDELQAAILLPVGEALADRDPNALILAGVDPITEESINYEGLIPIPVMRST